MAKDVPLWEKCIPKFDVIHLKDAEIGKWYLSAKSEHLLVMKQWQVDRPSGTPRIGWLELSKYHGTVEMDDSFQDNKMPKLSTRPISVGIQTEILYLGPHLAEAKAPLVVECRWGGEEWAEYEVDRNYVYYKDLHKAAKSHAEYVVENYFEGTWPKEGLIIQAKERVYSFELREIWVGHVPQVETRRMWRNDHTLGIRSWEEVTGGKGQD